MAGNQVLQALKNAGIPAPILPFAYAQTAMESNGFKSDISIDDNNFSGILFINKPYQKNATRSWKHKLTDSGMYVAHFATVQDWANDFKRVLSLGVRKPIDSTEFNDYFTRLKANNYYGKESVASYSDKVKSWLQKLNITMPEAAAGFGLVTASLAFLLYKLFVSKK